MPLPPRDDPQRPLALAIRSTRLLGIVMILLSFIPLLSIGFAARSFSGLPAWIEIIAISMILLLILGPGVMYLLCSIFMKRRRKWAIIVAIILSSIQLAWIGFSGATLIASIVESPGQNSGIFVAMGLIVIFMLAFIQLLVHLSKSFSSLRHIPIGGERGFSPIMVQPVEQSGAASSVEKLS